VQDLRNREAGHDPSTLPGAAAVDPLATAIPRRPRGSPARSAR
jgi:hypothetical protein